MAALLEVEDLKAFYGQTQALHGVTFSLEPGGITTLLGANGAGKTTLLRALSGNLRAWSGSITLDGQVLGKSSPWTRARAAPGVGHTRRGPP